MEKLNVKTTKSKVSGNPKTQKNMRLISDDEIRQRAFEISQENGNISDELQNWLKAESELRQTDTNENLH